MGDEFRDTTKHLLGDGSIEQRYERMNEWVKEPEHSELERSTAFICVCALTSVMQGRIAELECDLEEFRAAGEECQRRAENAEARLGRFTTDEDPEYTSKGVIPICIECGDLVTDCENPQYCAEIVAIRRGRLADRKRAETAKAQLPDEMRDCIILCKECRVGHSWLTAANWVDFECPTCERNNLRERAETAEKELANYRAQYADLLDKRQEAEVQRDTALEVCRDFVNGWDKAETNKWKDSLAWDSPLTVAWKKAKAVLGP